MVNWEFFDNQTPESAKRLVDDLRAGRAGRAHPRRPAVHLQGDRPDPGRLPRRAPGRRRGDRRRGPRLADRSAAGQGREPGAARVVHPARARAHRGRRPRPGAEHLSSHDAPQETSASDPDAPGRARSAEEGE